MGIANIPGNKENDNPRRRIYKYFNHLFKYALPANKLPNAIAQSSSNFKRWSIAPREKEFRILKEELKYTLKNDINL